MTATTPEYRTIPKSVPVALGERTYIVKPFGFGQIPTVTSLALPLFTSFASNEGPVRLDKLLRDGGENLMQLLALAIGEPREFIDTLDYDEGKALLQAVMAVNAETFTKKVLPDLMALMPAQAPAGTVAPKQTAKAG